MPFWKKTDLNPEPPPPPEYTFEVFPENIVDGEHEFDGVKVFFAKPGWQWIILEKPDGEWTRMHSYGKGYSTRDAALVGLLEAAKELDKIEDGDFEASTESIGGAASGVESSTA